MFPSLEALPAAEDRDRGVHPFAGLLLVAVVCVGVYWSRLGDTGLSMSEGHRVLPAWAMLDSGEWLAPRLFGQVYLRKPPGMVWAVAGASAALGRTEFAARAVSAAASTAMALVAFAFAARWFGSRWAAAAGLACALMPMLWEGGRSAEIEALNNLGTQIAVLAILDLLVFGAAVPARARAALMAGVAATGLVIAGLAKGPASAPCIAGAVLGACASRGTIRAALHPGLWGAVAAAGAVLSAAAWLVWRGMDEGAAVSQSPWEFLWPRGRVTEILTLAPESLLLAFPLSLGLLFPWGADARADAARSGQEDRARRLVVAVSLGCVLSLALMTAAGVYNPRYAIPAFVATPLIVPYVLRFAVRSAAVRRRRVCAVLVLGNGAAWGFVLLALSLAYIVYQQHDRERASGRGPGVLLAESLPDGAEISADGLIDARPEVLHYALAEAGRQGRRVSARWVPGLVARAKLPARGRYVVLRTDEGLDEVTPALLGGRGETLEPVVGGRVHDFRFELFRMGDGARGPDGD